MILLPKDTTNPIIWCERCQKHHLKYTFTQEDCNRIVSEAVTKLTTEIDARAARLLISDLKQ